MQDSIQEPLEETPKMIALSPKTSKKILIIGIVFIIMVLGIPGIILISFTGITYIGWARKKLEGSQYSIKDLWGERSAETWGYLNKISKSSMEKFTSKTMISNITEGETKNEITNNGTTPTTKVDTETIKEDKNNIAITVHQINKTINTIVGIVIIFVFLFNILAQTQIGDNIVLYFTNLLSRDNSNRQINNSYIARIILAILIVFIIFMGVKTLISYHKSDIKPPFNS